MDLRAARRDDVPAMDAIARRAKAALGYAPAVLAAWDAALCTAPGSLARQPAWVIEEAAAVVAFCQIDPQTSPWRLHALWVEPAWQRRGLGSRLARHAAGLARAAGERFLAVDAEPLAEGHYLALGALRIGALPAPIPGDDARVRPQLLLPVDEPAPPATASLAAAQPVRAPDGSTVHPLLRAARGSIARFALAPGQVSRAVAHRRVEELWYVVEGAGSMWRRQGASETVVTLAPGTALTIPAGTAFQFRADDRAPLVAIGVTMPPWPGDDEARAVPGRWPAP
jgi:mannose-6-phosphate isomerase-like protein (cupin superfamily)/GNAT superfamily N-acetyltransferase